MVVAKILQDINIGTNLKRIRKSRNMTQNDVCAKLTLMGRPMCQSNYAKIETGAGNIFISDLVALKRIYKVSFDEFFEGLEPLDKSSEYID